MKIAVCLDDKNGMMFARRRQSMDSLLRRDLLNMTSGSRLWMNAYSAGQFTEPAAHIQVDEQFLLKAPEGDWCFVENADLAAVADKVTQIAIYRWNRVYPSDRKFPEELFLNRWKMVQVREFPGSSHERITLEVYEL